MISPPPTRTARRFYERHGWRLHGETRTARHPPYPVDVGYTVDLT